MAAKKKSRIKVTDSRRSTKGGGEIRLEHWTDAAGNTTNYNMAYVNLNITSDDKGRVFGLDDAHKYPGFVSKHHGHWYGEVFEVRSFVSHDDTLQTFQQTLEVLKRQYGKAY